MATINHKTYNEATETFKDFNVYDGKETLIFKVDGSEGNVGIGTATPAYNLHVNASGDSRIIITDSAQGSTVNDGTYVRQSGVNSSIVNQENGTLQFGTNNSFVQTILANGNVGIGTSTPTEKLDVNGAVAFRGATASFASASAVGMIDQPTSGITRMLSFGPDVSTLGSFQFYITGANNTGGVSPMTITNTGNVGIGTSSPSGKLHVAGGDIFLGASYALKYNSTSYITPENNVSGAEVSTGGVFVVKTGVSPAERLRVDASGNVGIGTSSPAYKLQINASGGNGLSLIGDVDNESSVLFGDSGSAAIGRLTYSNIDDSMRIFTNGTEKVRITSAGKVGINTTSALGQLNIKNESAGATTNALALYNTPSNTENTGVAIEFYPNVGVDDRCARISSVNPTTTGTNLSDLRFFTSNNAAPTEKMRITHTGNVGIGTDFA
jgi:hypothetical protein